VEKTARGFDITKFSDRYGNECSLQKSSIATEDCIWFGVDDPKPMRLIPGQGWTPVEFPEDTLFHNRMHLTQDQVKALLPYLRKFVKTGELT
jgi:hypothetical protein